MRTTVMEGSLADFDLASVIQVVSIGRQYTGIELFDDAGNVVGTLFLKSGKILAANSGSTSGLDAITTLVRGRRHKRFSVYRTEPLADLKSPVGSVGEVLLKLLEPDAPPPPEERTPVMEGNLIEFDLLSVLQVISIGRQFTSLELFDTQGQPRGRIEIKAGKVLSAAADHLTGIEAIRRMARSPRETRFVVSRSRTAVGEHHLGGLGQILLKLADPDDEWDVSEPNTRARSFVNGEGGRASAPAPAQRAAEASAPPNAPSSPPPPPAAPAAERTSGPPPLPPGASLRKILSPPPQRTAVPPLPSRTVPLPAPEATRPRIEARQDRSDNAPPPGPAAFVDAFSGNRPAPAQRVAPSEAPIICVTSPKGGAGKTTVALNLGVAFARQGKRVVLVDSDANGVLLALNATTRSGAGAHDVIQGSGKVTELALKTKIAGLQILPSGEARGTSVASAEGWRRVFAECRTDADVVLVDTGAGLQGASGEVCSASTHALVVLPAEPAGVRALPAHLRKLSQLCTPAPQIVGIVLNMLDYRARVSLDTLQEVCGGPLASFVFDIPIARSTAFMEAVARGVPVCRGERSDTPTIGWVFEMLASGILERLGMLTPVYDETILV